MLLLLKPDAPTTDRLAGFPADKALPRSDLVLGRPPFGCDEGEEGVGERTGARFEGVGDVVGFVGRRPCAPVGGNFLSVPDIVLVNGVVAWDPDNVVS